MAYSSKEGKELRPQSIKFDSVKREFTIFGQAGSQDVFTSGESTVDVVVKVTGTAGPNLSTSMQFLVTLSRDSPSSKLLDKIEELSKDQQ